MDTRDAIAVLALLVALVMPVTTWFVARSRNDHEAHMAREARTHQRLEALYVDVMEYAHLRADQVARRHPFMSSAGDPPPPALPSEEERRHLHARVDVLGSPTVQARLNELGDSIRDFDLTAIELDDVHAGKDTGRPPIEARRELDANRAAFRAALEALTAACGQELR